MIVPKDLKERIRNLTSLLLSGNLFVEVISSAVRLNQKNKEYTVYVILLYSKVTTRQGTDARQEYWRIQKRYSDFLELHDVVKACMGEEACAHYGLGKNPVTKNLFQFQSSMAPSKADQRRQTLQNYIASLIEANRVFALDKGNQVSYYAEPGLRNAYLCRRIRKRQDF
jgi:hypothetical protein